MGARLEQAPKEHSRAPTGGLEAGGCDSRGKSHSLLVTLLGEGGRAFNMTGSLALVEDWPFYLDPHLRYWTSSGFSPLHKHLDEQG